MASQESQGLERILLSWNCPLGARLAVGWEFCGVERGEEPGCEVALQKKVGSHSRTSSTVL